MTAKLMRGKIEFTPWQQKFGLSEKEHPS